MNPTSTTEEVVTSDGALVERLTVAADIGHRAATTWVNYPGDVTGAVVDLLDRSVPMGPNTIGEWLWPVSAAFDAGLKRTRVGFSYIAPATHRDAA